MVKGTYDEEDSSVTGSDEKFKQLFKEAALRLWLQSCRRASQRICFPCGFMPRSRNECGGRRV